MKRILRLATASLLVCVLSSCASPPPEEPEPMPDTSQVEDLEQRMLTDFQNRDFDSMLNRMTSDILILGPDGVVDRALWRARIGQQMCEFEDDLSLEDETIAVLAPTVVLISYRTTGSGTCDEMPVEPQLSSSVWVWDNGDWLTASHHSTPMPAESEGE